MRHYEKRPGVKKSPKAEADRRYYLRNRARILTQAKARADRRRAELAQARQLGQKAVSFAPPQGKETLIELEQQIQQLPADQEQQKS